jgi:hypothetical protein
MKTAPILFLDIHVEQIIDHQTKLAILEKIRSISGLDFQAKSFQWLRHEDLEEEESFLQKYAVGLLTRGMPYWMFLTRVDRCCYAVLIEKKLKPGYPFPKMLLANFRFSESLHSDTLFDVEFVRAESGRSKNQWVMIIGDLLIDRSLPTRTLPLIKRLNRIYEMLETDYDPNLVAEPCSLQVRKVFVQPKNTGVLLRFAGSLPYPARGLAFYPLHGSPLLAGAPNKLHWEDKARVLQRVQLAGAARRHALGEEEGGGGHNDMGVMTVELLKSVAMDMEANLIFTVKKTPQPDVYHLYIQETMEKDRLSFYDVGHVPSLDTSRELKQYFKDNPERSMVMCECSFYEEFDKWGVEVVDSQKEPSCLLKLSIA